MTLGTTGGGQRTAGEIAGAGAFEDEDEDEVMDLEIINENHAVSLRQEGEHRIIVKPKTGKLMPDFAS